MNTFDLVIPGRLRSDQDRSRSDSTGALLTNPDLQKRLGAVYKAYRRFGACGAGATKTINGIVYHAVCGPDYLLRVNVQLLMGVRHPGQQPDADNLWKPLQNALAMPPPHLKVPGVWAATCWTRWASPTRGSPGSPWRSLPTTRARGTVTSP